MQEQAAVGYLHQSGTRFAMGAEGTNLALMHCPARPNHTDAAHEVLPPGLQRCC